MLLLPLKSTDQHLLMAHVTDAHIQLYPVVHDVCILLHRCALFRLVTDVIIKHVVMQSPVWSRYDRPGHYILPCGFYLSSSFYLSYRLISAVGD